MFERSNSLRMADSTRAEFDDYRWIHALTTYGILLPDIELLWMEWWSVGTIGRAVSAAQYVSALMYPNEDNPVFARWTRDEGGGPPCL